jgi:hypothetical protein
MKTIVTILFGSFLFLAVGTVAQAQSPYTRPPVSPYWNLYRGGQPGNLNYYNLVRPDLEFRSSIQQLRLQNQTTQQSLNDLQAPAGTLVTGHQAGFQTQSTYFQTISTGPVSTSGFTNTDLGPIGRPGTPIGRSGNSAGVARPGALR